MDNEEKEFKEYEKLLEEHNAGQKMISEYKEILPLMEYPPLNLKKNYWLFRDDILTALSKISASKGYNPSIIGDLIKKWDAEISEAKKNSKQMSISPLDATVEYMKSKKNLTYKDFGPLELFR